MSIVEKMVWVMLIFFPIFIIMLSGPQILHLIVILTASIIVLRLILWWYYGKDKKNI